MSGNENDDFYKDWIRRRKRFIEETLQEWDKIRPDGIPIANFGLAMDARLVGVYSLLLGEKVEAREWFKKSSEFYIRSVVAYRSIYGPLADEELKCVCALYMAILSNDPGLVDEGIKLSLASVKGHPPRRDVFANNYYYNVSFASFLAGDNKNAMLNLARINPLKPKKFKMYYEGLVGMLTGLVENSKTTMLEGMNILLMYHDKTFAGSTMPEGIISIDATVYIKIAREKGIIINHGDIDKGLEKYIPWNLFE